MKIMLEGACNARDLCDIETKYGKIRQGRLIRCGELSRLTAADSAALRQLGLKRVIDLRTAAEMANTPDVRIPGTEYINISVIRSTTFGITYEKSSGQEIAEMLQAGFKRMQARGETYGEHMNLLYRNFVNDGYCRAAYGEFLRLLAEKPVGNATLWHCTAGKDRVGTCTALLLHCLGADRKQIVDDYMLTNEQSRENKLSILNKVRDFVSEENLQLIEKMLSVDESFLQDFFDETDKNFGGTDNFLTECGVTHDHIEMLRANYLYRE